MVPPIIPSAIREECTNIAKLYDDIKEIKQSSARNSKERSAQKNKINYQKASTEIFNQMILAHPELKIEDLREMTEKARKIYTLFNGIGIDKIGFFSECSIDDISSLTDAQIQDIIIYYTDKLAILKNFR
ncbi:13298_t:CDS:2 [Entrophospora sp. SA101]|nr:13298_t:CDS:2 [Entrophospora sp. SA101]